MSTDNNLSWLVNYIKEMVEQGIEGANVSTMVGEVISPSPIQVKVADIVLDGEDLLIPDLYMIEDIKVNLTGSCGENTCLCSGTIEWPLKLEKGDKVTLNLVGDQFLMTAKVVSISG